MLTEDGCVDLTVADVMGKGVGAGLLMATVRAVLRATPKELSLAERVRVAGDSLVGKDTGLFVTMVHARLEPASGFLRYVDAGHGYCAIRKRDGELVSLPERSLPLGVPEEELAEGDARLGLGDSLIVYSDGLVERDDDWVELDDMLTGVDGSASAAELVRHLLDQAPAPPTDDVTVLVLRRQPETV